MKATEQYFPVVLFVVLYKVVLTFESVDEILKCDHSTESHWAVHSFCAAVCNAVHADMMWTKSESVTIQMKATEQYFPVVLFIMLYKVVLTVVFECMDEILNCDHSNERLWVVLACAAVSFSILYKTVFQAFL